MKTFCKRLGLRILQAMFGIKMVDQRTGEIIAKVVVLRWRGKLRFLGLNGVAVRPHFLPQEKEVYWAQDLGFSTHPPPDFPNVTHHHRIDLAPVAAGSGQNVPDVAATKS